MYFRAFSAYLVNTVTSSITSQIEAFLLNPHIQNCGWNSRHPSLIFSLIVNKRFCILCREVKLMSVWSVLHCEQCGKPWGMAVIHERDQHTVHKLISKWFEWYFCMLNPSSNEMSKKYSTGVRESMTFPFQSIWLQHLADKDLWFGDGDFRINATDTYQS